MMSAAAKSKPKPTVFIVDDDISIRESLELLIKFAGWQPETFASAEEFLARPSNVGPSCLVLDVSLPNLSGLDLQKLITADHANMPIIFITGHGDVPMTVQAMKAGAVEFLTKPFDDEVLLSAIRHAIKRSMAVLNDQAEITALGSNYESLTPREQEVMRSMEVFDGLRDGTANHRSQFYQDITMPFYGYNRPGAKISQGIRDNWWRQGMMGGIKAQYDCIKALSETEFYEDFKIIDVPVLVMHGEDDQIVPFAVGAARSIKLLKHGTLKAYPGFPHGMPTTNAARSMLTCSPSSKVKWPQQSEQGFALKT